MTMDKNKQTTAPAFMQDMVALGTNIIHNYTDIPHDCSEQIAHHLATSMMQHWGGSMLYVPKTTNLDLHKRDLAIWDEFNGRNHNQLARKYNLSVITIYQILAKVRDRLPKQQDDLFDNQPTDDKKG